MNPAVCIVVLVLCTIIVETQSQTAPILNYDWKTPEDGKWHTKDNWNPRGIPRSGNHLARFNHIGAGRYTVTHEKPIIAGDIIVEDSVELILNATIGVLVDPDAIAQPVVELTGQTLGFPTTVFVEDLSLAYGTVEVNATNIRTGDMETLTLSSREDVGEFWGEFLTFCDEANPISESGDGILNALPFDIIEVIYNPSPERYASARIVLAFMEPYQERLGWPVVSKSLMSYATQKTIAKLLHLKEKLIYILDNLPPYEANDCCPNEEYRYPLDIAPFAERSYQFYTGNIFGPVGCEDLISYCYQVKVYGMDFSSSVVVSNRTVRSFTWTGTGLSFNWDDAKNWMPYGVPDSANDFVHFPEDATVFLTRHVEIGQIQVDGSLDLYKSEYELNVGGSTYETQSRQVEQLDENLVMALEEKISIKTILQALFGDKFSD